MTGQYDGRAMSDDPLVLVVEDVTNHSEPLEALLASTPYRYLVAGSAPEALALLNKHTPDLVIAPINLGALSGFDLAERVQEEPRLAETAVLLLPPSIGTAS